MLHRSQRPQMAAIEDQPDGANHRQASEAVTSNAEFVEQLRLIVGRPFVIIDEKRTRRYRTGFRFGVGPALAVVRPGSLIEQWRVFQACVAANKAIIVQSANTGLTGGSTPNGDGYGRDVIIINTLRVTGLHLINNAEQVICLPGSTLFDLERALKPFGREPHSVIGSSCIGASVFGGICNNSGGSLVGRGPAYTQLAVYAHVDATGNVELVNHLNVNLGRTPDEILENLEAGRFNAADIINDPAVLASDRDYQYHVRDVSAGSPARFNADPRRLFEASGSAGKLMLFAVRLDTFPREDRTRTFYIGTNDPHELTQIRRCILRDFQHLPIAAEYIHRDAFNMAETYGKDLFLAIRFLGTAKLPALFALKGLIDVWSSGIRFLPSYLSDRLMQLAGRALPKHLPKRMTDFRDRFEHHLLLKVSCRGIQEATDFLTKFYPSPGGNFFECTEEESEKAFLHRFAVASSAVRYRAIHNREVEDIVALDVALRRNETHWLEVLPPDIDKCVIHKVYYGHFLCHVFHQDYIVAKGSDAAAIDHRILKLQDERGAEYPAEHNVGHLYAAKPQLLAHYRSLDPCNCLNPGIGRTSKLRCWT